MSIINASGNALVAILDEHDNRIETVSLQCTTCGVTAKKQLPHSIPDAALLRDHFRGWKAKGVRRAKKTVCPECRGTDAAVKAGKDVHEILGDL